jgi:hypothetical protein
MSGFAGLDLRCARSVGRVSTALERSTMFARIITSVCSQNGAGLIMYVTLDVAGVEYEVTYLHGAVKSFFIKSGKNTETGVSCTHTAERILGRELRRRGLDRAPKEIAVDRLTVLIHKAVFDARNAYEHDMAAAEGQNDPPHNVSPVVL